MPHGYFAASGVATLAKYRAAAEPARDPALLGGFPMADLAASIATSWRPAGVAIYRNWLNHLAALRSPRRFQG
jgi:hypothetical protein